MMEFVQVMWLPFLACLVLTGIHAYLGLHVIERQVIFVDLALAQIAVLGSSIALLLGFELDSTVNYWFSLSFTIWGALIFSLTRLTKNKIPQEAIVGIIYVVSAAMLLIVLSFSGEGTEHIRHSLIGNILLVQPAELLKMTMIYVGVGTIHFIFRKQFYLISTDTDKARSQGLNIRGWDFLFYVTLGLVVTSSVKLAGVLLVFSFLVIPAVCAMVLAQALNARLFWGWGIGTIGSVLGISVSYILDIPTGASVVCSLGVILLCLSFIKK
jgi:zinc/manganese transport system permease protein